jgi:photosystem II stability/assembly factor-like uncharacterized protein
MNRRLAPLLFAVAIFLVPSTRASAQRPATPRPATPPTVPPEQNPAFEKLKFRMIGPFDGGRVTRVAGLAGDAMTIYAATASGGVWKTVDGGFTWKPIFDDQPISSVGSIAVAPSDPNVIYVGSGEANIRGNVAAGNGIYKSLDAGKTWKHVWAQEGQIGTMVVHPRNPDIAFAAVLGHAFGPNPERGVYRTEDGGQTWQPVLRTDANTGASDVALDPSNPNIVFAGFWQARRTPWSLTSGGPGSGLFVSRDGGDTWDALTENGLPPGPWGRIGIAAAPSDGRRVYALIEADSGGLFRSVDGGENWERATPSHLLTQRAWYYSTLTVNPVNADDVWFPQVSLVRTIDGGATLKIVKDAPHGDYHDVWIDPTNPKRIIAGHDGGVAISHDSGETWYWPFMPLGQFYHVATDSRVPYDVQGAMQDIGTEQGPSDNLNRGGINAGDWHEVGGGEAGWVVSNRADPDIVYAGEYLGIITIYDHRTRTSRNISAYPENPSGHGDIDAKYRFQWTAPISASPHDPAVIYHGANVLFMTRDGGQTWRAISPDLTRNDTTKQRWSGGPITGDNTGVEYYSTIFAVAESPLEKGLIWVGSDDGLVHVTRDGGGTWTDVTKAMPGFPEWGTVSLVEPSPFDAGTAYVVVDAHRLDDMHPYLYRTTDYGHTWTRLDAGLPQNVYLHAIRVDPAHRGLLYLGTERGIMLSRNDGATWQPLKLNLPTVAVHDLVVQGSDLVVGTHGRSLWILDDLTPIRTWSDSISASKLHLFAPRETILWRRGASTGIKPEGENAPAGAIVYYWTSTKPDSAVTLEIVDAQGAVVRTLSSIARPKDGYSETEEAPKPELMVDSARIQRAVWDLRLEGARRIRNAMIDTGDPADGPWAPPGRYTLRLRTGSFVSQTSLTVQADPRSMVTDADLAAQHAFALELRNALDQLTTSVEQIRDMRTQLADRNRALVDRADAAVLRGRSDSLVVRLDSLEHVLHNPDATVTYDILAKGSQLYSRLTPLYMFVIDGDGAPTQGAREVWAGQRQELQSHLARLQVLIDNDLAAINSLAEQIGVPFIVARRPPRAIS